MEVQPHLIPLAKPPANGCEVQDLLAEFDHYDAHNLYPVVQAIAIATTDTAARAGSPNHASQPEVSFWRKHIKPRNQTN